MKKWITLVVAVALPTTLSLASETSAETLALYKKKCASCHGTDGKGDTKMGKKLGSKDYTDSEVQKKVTDADMARAIKKGLKVDGKIKMKGFEDLTDKEITGLVVLMREFAKK